MLDNAFNVNEKTTTKILSMFTTTFLQILFFVLKNSTTF